jgi:hypothetical protein
MKALTFWRGALLAICISVVGAVLHTVLARILGGAISLRLVILIASLSYVLALLAHGPGQSGRVVAALAWLGLAGLLLVFNPPLTLWLLLQTGFIWLLRSLQRYDSLIPAGSDALLSGFALAGAIATAQHTHSLFLALWSYFLVQALAAFISVRYVTAPAASAGADSDFESSYRNAETALRNLSLRS